MQYRVIACGIGKRDKVSTGLVCRKHRINITRIAKNKAAFFLVVRYKIALGTYCNTECGFFLVVGNKNGIQVLFAGIGNFVNCLVDVSSYNKLGTIVQDVAGSSLFIGYFTCKIILCKQCLA